jgi:hypothetical protein
VAVADRVSDSDYPTPPVDLDGIYWSQSLAAGIPTFDSISGTDSRLRVSVGFSPTFPAGCKGHLSMRFQISSHVAKKRVRAGISAFCSAAASQ